MCCVLSCIAFVWRGGVYLYFLCTTFASLRKASTADANNGDSKVRRNMIRLWELFTREQDLELAHLLPICPIGQKASKNIGSMADRSGGGKSIQIHMPDRHIAFGKISIQRYNMPHRSGGKKKSRSICPTYRIWEKSSKDICPTDQEGEKTSRYICMSDISHWPNVIQNAPQIGGKKHPKTYYAPQITKDIP